MPTTPRIIFIIDLTYVASLSDIDANIPAHLDYLNEGYKAGVFLASGRKEPRTGGIIIATDTSMAEVQTRTASDPFVQKKMATVKITEFHPSKGAPDFFSSFNYP